MKKKIIFISIIFAIILAFAYTFFSDNNLNDTISISNMENKTINLPKSKSEELKLSNDSEKILLSHLDKITAEENEKFYSLYDKWTESIINNENVADINIYTNVSQYQDLENYIDENDKKLWSLIINNYLLKQDIYSNLLLVKIVNYNADTMSIINKIKEDTLKAKQNNTLEKNFKLEDDTIKFIEEIITNGIL